ncbi:MAG: hypothetical protein M3506_10165 [Chloroflexota bacterium]|nr:hypothetical protein [Chloroflexota bacterium]
MRSRTTRSFRALLAALPAPIRRQARAAFGEFERDPYHPSLQFKRVVPSDPTIYSVRISLRYRALCSRRDGDAVWFWIGSHADYDQMLRS